MLAGQPSLEQPLTTNVNSIDLARLTPKQFEELVYDLLEAEEFQHLDWRDGGADGGRDIVAMSLETDGIGFREQRIWFCDAKLYSTGIGFEVIQSTLAKATAQGIDYLLFAVWPHLTPPAKDNLEVWKETNRPRFKIRIWEKKDIERLLLKHPDILKKYLPAEWTERLAMDAYLRESIEVFRQFRNRVSVIWKNPDARPFSDLLRMRLNPNIQTPGKPRVSIIDQSHSINDTERAFLIALADALRTLEEILAKALNIVQPTVFLQNKWVDHPEVRLLIPILQTNILRPDIRDGVQAVLGLFHKAFGEGGDSGILAGSSRWKPWADKNHVSLYAVFPKPSTGPADDGLLTPPIS